MAALAIRTMLNLHASLVYERLVLAGVQTQHTESVRYDLPDYNFG